MTIANNKNENGEVLRVANAPHDWGPRGTAGVSFAAALEFDQVDVRIDGRPILRGVDLTLVPGEVVCLLGESGSGKSTILRVAAGIQDIQAGRVLVNDVVVSSAQEHVPPDRRGIGLMFQDFALFPHMSVLENVAFGLSRSGKKEARQQARAALSRVGLAEREKDYPHMLSGGQQQRLALARSFAPRPGILMLDEPFSSLDARLRESVRAQTLTILKETGATTLIVTHDPEEAMVLGDRIALLRDGRIIQIDSAVEIYNHPSSLYAARFFSPLTEISTQVQSGVAETPLGSLPVPDRPDGKNIIVAIRPLGALEICQDGVGTAGRLLSKRQALGVDLCEIAVVGIDQPIHLRRRSDAMLQVGDDILLRLNPQHVLVFDQE